MGIIHGEFSSFTAVNGSCAVVLYFPFIPIRLVVQENCPVNCEEIIDRVVTLYRAFEYVIMHIFNCKGPECVEEISLGISFSLLKKRNSMCWFYGQTCDSSRPIYLNAGLPQYI